MLASTLLRQQALRCSLQNFNKNQTLIQRIPKVSNNSLVQSKFLATTAVQQSGDHVKLWTAERFVSLAQIPALIVPFVWTNFGTDVAFCTLAVLHSHWGKYMHTHRNNYFELHVCCLFVFECVLVLVLGVDAFHRKESGYP